MVLIMIVTKAAILTGIDMPTLTTAAASAASASVPVRHDLRNSPGPSSDNRVDIYTDIFSC